MTVETLDRAIEIKAKIEELERTLSSLRWAVSKREEHIELGERRWLPFSKWFCLGTVKGQNSVVMDAPREAVYPLNFELDKECVDFIIKHEEEKIEQLKKELEAL